MKKTTFIGLCVLLLGIQIIIYVLIDRTAFQKAIVYETVSENGQNRVVISKDKETYLLQVKKKGKTIHKERLKSGFQKVKEEATWIDSTYVFISYVDDEQKDVRLNFDFIDTEVLSDSDAFLDNVRKAQEKEAAEEKKQLEKEEKIATETGLSYTKASTVAVTYDYGKHWKDTGIYTSFMTFSNSDQLRLSEESYRIEKAFSFIYYCHSNGYLHYVVSKDGGAHWVDTETQAEAINTLWFQGFLKEDEQPSFFLADQTYGSIDCLDYFESQDDGATFSKHHFTLDKDMNKLADVSYIRDDLMFVSFYDEDTLYVTKDQGSTFESVTIHGRKEISYVETPERKDGVLSLIAHTQTQEQITYVSSDDGLSWKQQ